MQTIINNYLALIVFVFCVAGCDESAEITSLQEVSFSNNITASEDNVVILAEDSLENVLEVNWPAVDYHRNVPVTYTVQITTASDVNTWANAVEKEIGDDILATSYLGKELNTIAVDALGVEADAESELAIRVESYVDRAAFSEPVMVKVTPYKVIEEYPALWVAGDFQGWDVTTAPTIVSVNDDGIYEGYIYIAPEGTNEFKIYAQPDWSPVSYGTLNDGAIFEANYAGDNFVAPSDGYYMLAVDLNNMTYLLIKTEWGIIGGATPGGWDSDTNLMYNETSQTWSVTADMIADGSFKFRANHEWQIDFGLNEEGDVDYANHPWLEYVEQPQFTVPEDGNYTITLDLHEPGNYTYKIQKN